MAITVSEFREQMYGFGELKEFCWQNNLYYTDEIYSDESRDSYIEEEISYYNQNDGWRDAKDYLSYISTDHNDWWRFNPDYGEWYVADDEDFDAIFSECLEWALEQGVVIPDNNVEAEEHDAVVGDDAHGDEDSDDGFDADSCDFGGLFSESYAACEAELMSLRKAEEEAANASVAEEAPAPRVIHVDPDEFSVFCDEFISQDQGSECAPADPVGVLF